MKMQIVHFSTNNQVGINLSVQEQPNGDLFIIRTFQTPVPDEIHVPKSFTLRAEEKHGLLKYLQDNS